MTYHEKKYELKTAFPHTKDHGDKMQKAMKARGITKSELIRQLIDTL
jgi:hypothetical protein